MKNILLSIAFLAIVFSSCSSKQNNSKAADLYTIYRTDSTVVATGEVENGLKKGSWKVYDRKGVLKVERTYSAPFCFKQTKPSVFEFSTMSDSSGKLHFPEIIQTDVLWSKRIWRNYPYTDNETQITLDEFAKVPTYSDDQMQYDVSFETFPDSIDGFHFKEDYYFNKASRQTEIQIIAIAPTFKGVELFWTYYPELKNVLSAETHNALFERKFTSVIYKETKIGSTIDLMSPPEHIEKTLVEQEIGMWRRF